MENSNKESMLSGQIANVNQTRRQLLKGAVGSAVAASVIGKSSIASTKKAGKIGGVTLSGETEIVELPAWELSLHIEQKSLSCREVMSAYLEQIERVNGEVNALVAIQDGDQLMAEAASKDEALAKGEWSGWMHGFPLAIKDLEETKGVRTTFGSPNYAEWIPDYDSFMVKRMRAAGMIITGKSNTPEFGYGSHTYNPIYGATGNPYDPSKSAGGSSGGAACSLAMRLQPVADGSDFMGSLRNPAGWCNVFGFRPSWGRVPEASSELFINQFGINGPMGRSIPDVALLLNTQAGRSADVPASLSDDPRLTQLTPLNVQSALTRDHQGERLAWLGDWDGYLAMDPEVLAVCQEGLKAIESLGVTVESIAPPIAGETLWNECWLPHRHLCATSLKSLYDDPKTRANLKPEAIFEYEGGGNYSGRDFYAASLLRSEWYQRVKKLLTTFDYIAVPTAQIFPFDKRLSWPKAIMGRPMDTYHRWMEVVTPWTLSGNPVVAIPAGFNQQGMPMGIQVIGRHQDDFSLLQFAYAYELATDIVRKNPPPLLKSLR